MAATAPIKSPCNLVCQLDSGSGYCLGCGRTGDEIAAWLDYTDAEREAVMAGLPARLRAIGLPPGGDKEEGERRAAAQRSRMQDDPAPDSR